MGNEILKWLYACEPMVMTSLRFAKRIKVVSEGQKVGYPEATLSLSNEHDGEESQHGKRNVRGQGIIKDSHEKSNLRVVPVRRTRVN